MLTDRQIKTAKSKDKDYELKDGKGLHLRIKTNGKKQFFHRYTFFKKQKRKIIGDYPDISLAEARDIIADQKKTLAKGVDPIEFEQIVADHKKSNPTVTEFVSEYDKRYLKKELINPARPRYLLNRFIIPKIGNKQMINVTKRDIFDIIDPIVDRGSLVQANRVLSVVKGFFAFACTRGVISDDKNPTIGLTRKIAGGRESSRERFLSESEIKTLWEHLDTPKVNSVLRLAIKILLLTGLRVNEALGALKSEIDYQTRIWTIPVERLKHKKNDNIKPHKVMLTDLIIELLHEAESISVNSKYLFQSPHFVNIEKPMLRSSLTRMVRESLPALGIDKWTPHDLRRTLSTHMNEIPSINPWVVEKILAHKMQGVMAVYNRAEYLEQRREAMEIWSERIKQIISGEKVVQLKNKKSG